MSEVKGRHCNECGWLIVPEEIGTGHKDTCSKFNALEECRAEMTESIEKFGLINFAKVSQELIGLWLQKLGLDHAH